MRQLKNSEGLSYVMVLQPKLWLSLGHLFAQFAYYKEVCKKFLLFSVLSWPLLRSGSRALIVKDASLDWSSNPMEHRGRKPHVKYVIARFVYMYMAYSPRVRSR